MKLFGRRTPPAREPEPVPVAITDDVIRLGQLLKLADLVEDGAQAKELIAAGLVSVDGEVETRRGRQLRAGAVVALLVDDAPPPVVISSEPVPDDLPW
ncbi:hypothetical protein GCM10028771_10470 [Nocardioides marmoraquaticus]